MTKLRTLHNELAKVAIDEINEVPNRIESDLESLKSWLKHTPHLKTRTDDQFLLAFLRGCKYSLEKTKHKLDLFYSVRQNTPEVIRNRDPNNQYLMGMIRQG